MTTRSPTPALLLPATPAEHLGLKELFSEHVDLGRAPGWANVGDKAMTLVASLIADGDCIDDADALRAGQDRPSARPLDRPTRFSVRGPA
jgi:hypothetical protein